MKKDTALALAIVAFGTACYVAIGAEWPTPPPGMAYETDLKPHSLVVTNVVLDGVAKTADLDGKRDKTDLTVYTVAFSDWTITESVNTGVKWGVSTYAVGADFAQWWLNGAGGAGISTLPYDASSEKLVFKVARELFGFDEDFTVTCTREKIVTPSADTLATTSTVAKVAREAVNTVWDAELGVAWEARMHNGQLYYVAVTNRPPEGK